MTGRERIEEQSFHSLYEVASNMDRIQVNKVFNFGSFSSNMDRKLNKDLRKFTPLYGMQGIHLSSKFLVLAMRNSAFTNKSENVKNFLRGVLFVHTTVNMKKIFEMYNYDKFEAKDKTLLELLNEIHDVSVSRLQSIHNLTIMNIAKLNETTLVNLEDIGVDGHENTMHMLIKIAIRIGECLSSIS